MATYSPVTMSYTHTQAVASSTWTINHNLHQAAPVVDIWIDLDGVSTYIIPQSVTAPNDNTAVVEFSIPRAGIANVV